MTILQALAGYYDRMAARGEAPADGFSTQAVDYKLVIDADGEVVDAVDLRERSGKKVVRKQLAVPHPQRTSNVLPNFLWDKTAYLFGVTAGDDKRTAREHDTFVTSHIVRLGGSSDPALVAFRSFLRKWRPDRFESAPFTEDMKDKNFVVAMDGERRYLHETDGAAALMKTEATRALPEQVCLVTGERAPVAPLHPIIKNVWGAQSSGASLVSFNAGAFLSWGQQDGGNAPTSVLAAARYGVALNQLLLSASNRVQIGDATVAFWADTAGIDEAIARAAESVLADIFGTAAKAETDQDISQAARVREALEIVAAGRPAKVAGVDVVPGTQVHILGLSPNAARLSVRFWLNETMGELAANLMRHERDCRVEPLPWKTPPSINRLLVNTVATLAKWDNIPPLLAGEVARAVLAGTPYPRTLLANAIMRLRAGDDPTSGWHAAAIRAVLARSEYFRRKDRDVPEPGETPMSLDVTEKNPGYRLGRLFAVLEEAQERALGRVNASIRDRYFGAASATPASVFPLLLRGVQNHLGKLRKDEPGSAQSIEMKLGEIIGDLDSNLPRSLKLEEQGRFAIGYYHQRSERFRKKGEPATSTAADTEGTDGHD